MIFLFKSIGYFLFDESELARESGISGDINVECIAAFAGKPAPTRSALYTFFVCNIKPVGARLAREPCEARPFTDQAISRNSRRRILPTGVIGNDSRKTMCLGTLYAVKFSLQ